MAKPVTVYCIFTCQDPVKSKDVMAMEFLPINNNGGQGYGFTLYQTELDSQPKEVVINKVYDRVMASRVSP